MLQILGDSLMIATRMDARLYRHPQTPARPPAEEPEAMSTRRKGWLRLAGYFR